MAQKLIIDADPGIGDAVAIGLALLDRELDVLALTAVPGAVSGANATRNLQAIVEMLDPPKWPRIGASEASLGESVIEFGSSAVTTAALNGPTGLGDCDFHVAEMHHLRESAKVIIEVIRDQPDEVTLLTLGPLTNVELAAELEPEFFSLLGGLVCLAGSVECGGDVSAAAEFNVYADPEAARYVLRSPATKTLVPLDIAGKVVLTFDQYDRLPGRPNTPIGRFLEEILPFAFRAHHEHLGQEGIRLNELVALCAVAEPRLFEGQQMAVDVETSGELTRGMTVFDRRGIHRWQTNIEVLTEVDGQGVLDYFTRIVRRAAA